MHCLKILKFISGFDAAAHADLALGHRQEIRDDEDHVGDANKQKEIKAKSLLNDLGS